VATLRIEPLLWWVWGLLSVVYVGSVWFLQPTGSWYFYWTGPLSLACLVFLHDRTLGRSSPLAAAAFVLGPFGAIIGLVILAVQEADRTLIIGYQNEATFSVDIIRIAFLAVNSGLAAACVAAIVFAWVTRGEWIYYHTASPEQDNHSQPTIPSCLKAFGLDHSSTLTDLETAYRALVKRDHPDRGGTAEQFKKLQVHYSIASKLLKRYQRR